MFQSIYDSPWQHPGMAFVALAIFVVVFAKQQRFLMGVTVLLVFEMAADALTTGAFSPTKGHSIHVGASILFVILGDFRYFLITEQAIRWPDRLDKPGFGNWAGWGTGFALAMVVPILSTVPQTRMPEFFKNETRIFLLYEAMFFVWVLAVRFLLWRRRWTAVGPELANWIQRLTVFELVQYGLWITSDILILAGVEPARLLRIVPNFLYYCAFIPFAFFTAPARLRAT